MEEKIEVYPETFGDEEKNGLKLDMMMMTKEEIQGIKSLCKFIAYWL